MKCLGWLRLIRDAKPQRINLSERLPTSGMMLVVVSNTPVSLDSCHDSRTRPGFALCFFHLSVPDEPTLDDRHSR